MFSIIIPTYNRCQSLRETIESLLSQKVSPHCAVEVLIIDNNSTDGTKYTVEEFIAKSPWSSRYVFESRQGVSVARNRGIKEAKGDYLIFADDDVLFCEGWLQAVIDTFIKGKADCVSGKIIPAWSCPPFPWIFQPQFRSVLRGVYVSLDHGPETKEFKELDYDFAFSANVAFSKKTLDEVGGFREDLGMKGNQRFYGEETDLIVRCFKAGKKMVYCPTAAVRHKIPEARLTMNYIRKWRYDKGLDAIPENAGFWLVKEWTKNAFSFMIARVRGKEMLALERELQFWTQCGQIMGILKRKFKR